MQGLMWGLDDKSSKKLDPAVNFTQT